MAHAAINAGADMIIGHHPHVVQSIERYRGRIIVYSLGNFIFDQYFSPDTQEGLAVLLDRIGLNLIPLSSKKAFRVPWQNRKNLDFSSASPTAAIARSQIKLKGELSTLTDRRKPRKVGA